MKSRLHGPAQNAQSHQTFRRKIKYEASPTACDGKIYIVNFTGDVVVVSAADGKILHQTPFGTSDDKQIRSAIVPTHGQLLLRTDTQLFCIGKR
jgi:outer membrane protein assembly factor BamB